MELFVHLPDYKVVVCKKCKYAVLPSHIDAHLAGEKHGLKKIERDIILEEIAEIDGLIGNEETLKRSEFPFPPAISQPIAALVAPSGDGFECKLERGGRACTYICCTEDGMRKHCLAEHRWKSTDKGGRPQRHQKKKRAKEVAWHTRIYCQRFFIQGPKSNYFKVANPQPRSYPNPQIQSRIDQFAKAKKELERALRAAEDEENRKIKEFEESREPNRWLRRVGWVPHLTDIDRSDAREWVETPDEEEPELQILCTAFDWMIQDAQFNATQDVVSQAALFEANRKELDKEPQMPFDSWMDITTIRSYTRVWRQLLCYIIRTQDQPEKRPPYELTDRQQLAIQETRNAIKEFQDWKKDQPELGEEEDESDEEIAYMNIIQKEILGLCITLLDHPLQDTEYKNAIISGLAVLGIRGDDGWFGPEDYTSKYSAVIKLARLMVVQKGYEKREGSIKRAMERGLTAEEARRQAKGYYHHIHQMTNRFMVMAHSGRDPTPMQWIFKSRSYGMKIRYTTTAEGCIQWIGDTVLYQKMRFGISQFRSMIQGIVEEAREELFGNLMKVDIQDPSKIPSINWDHMFDNPSESRVGWSFLDDERSKFEVDGQWWLYERMYQEQDLREHFMDEDPTKPFKEEAAYEYQQSIDRFRELLLFLMHISSQPPRAPEILGLRWKNTGQGGERNIFIEDGLVAYVAAYHKGYRNSGSIKIIHRYLPKEVGELLVYYLWLVLPFHEKLQFHATGSFNNSAFLWGDGEKKEHRQWTGPRRGRKERTESRVGSQESRNGTGSPPRQGRDSTPSQGRDSPPRQGRKPKSPSTQEWNSERLRHIIQSASERYIGVKIHISALRQIVIAMSRRFCRENPFLDGKSHPEDDQEGDVEDDEWDLQTGHGTHVGGMIYGRELMENRDTVISRREKFRDISQIWHRFLEFPSTDQGSGIGQKRKRSSIEDDIQEAQRGRLARLRHVDIREQLKQMEGSKAEFRGNQEPALNAIMGNKSRILVIMGTGGGKSLMFQLPARSQKSGTTVVIVPLKSLEKNLHQRCKDAGISCIQWDPQKSSRSAQIILVQPESVISVRFAQQLNRLQGLGQLDRIVMDECHTVLDSSPDFRPAMKEAGALMLERGVQMVYLTATLPPSDESEFFDIIRVEPDEMDSIDIFRGATTRPNIRYSVEEHSSDIEEHEKVKELVGLKLEQYPAPAKVIVYGSSIDSIRELGETLGCHIYFHDVGSHGDKDRIQEQWQSANGRVIVASNAFGLGIDSPDVRVVIHVGPIYQMRSYVQESGRAGRDGKMSEAIIIRGEGLQEALQQSHARARNQPAIAQPIFTTADKERAEKRKVDEFISGANCRRIYLDQEMDGRVDRTKCEGIEERCDVCEKGEEEVAMVERMRKEYKEKQERKAREQNRGFDSGINIPTSTQIPISTPISDDAMESPLYIQSSPPMIESIYDNSSQSIQPSNSSVNDIPRPPELPKIIHDSPGSIRSSPSSVVSFDQGFTAKLIQVTDDIDMQARRDEREQTRLKIQVQNQQSNRRIQGLEEQLKRLKGHCPLCTVRRLDDRKHSIYDCKQREAMAFEKGWKDMRQTMRERKWFEVFSCCTWCHVPQAICRKWEYNEENGRWKESNMNCQFDEIIMAIVAMGIQNGNDWMIRNMVRWAEEGGFEVGNQEHTYKWFGQKMKWGRHDISRLAQVFYDFVYSIEV